MSDVKKTKTPLQNDTGDELSKEEMQAIQDQEKEIAAAGVDVTKIEVCGGGAPPRFHINFRPGKPSAEVRMRLEEKRYDVGQNLGDKNLSFYVTKRVEQTKGWSV
jgi:hypothetical protein